MAFKVELPIRSKLPLWVSGAILIATAAYLSLAIKLFRDDKAALVNELNFSNVNALAAQVDAVLARAEDQARLLTRVALEKGDAAIARSVFESDPDFVAFTLYRPGQSAGHWDPSAAIRNPEYLKLYGLDASAVDKVKQRIAVPFSRVLSMRTWLMSSTLPGGAPIVSYALALDGDSVGVVDLRADKLLKSFSGKGVAQTYLLDGEGSVIAHPDVRMVESRASLAALPIVAQALRSSMLSGPSGSRSFHWDGQHWIGAYATLARGHFTVVSQVEEGRAFLPADRLIEKSLAFAALVVTLAAGIAIRIARGSVVGQKQEEGANDGAAAHN